MSERPLSPCGPDDARSSQITYKKRRGAWAPNSADFCAAQGLHVGTGCGPAGSTFQGPGHSRGRRAAGGKEGSALHQTRSPERRTPSSAGPPATGLSGPLWGAEASISPQAPRSQMRNSGLKGETGLPKSHGQSASDLWLAAGSQPYTFLSPLLAQALPAAPPRQAEGLPPSLCKDSRSHPPPLVPFSHCRSHVQGSSSGPPGTLGTGA